MIQYNTIQYLFLYSYDFPIMKCCSLWWSIMLIFRTVKFSILHGCNALFNPKLSKNELGLNSFFCIPLLCKCESVCPQYNSHCLFMLKLPSQRIKEVHITVCRQRISWNPLRSWPAGMDQNLVHLVSHFKGWLFSLEPRLLL